MSEIVNLVFFLLVVVGFGAVFIFLKKHLIPHTSHDLQTENNQIRQEKKELEGKLSEVVKQNERFQSELRLKDQLLDERNKSIYELKSKLEQKEKEVKESIKDLSHSKQKFQEEQERVRKEEKEKIQREKEDRNRIWSQHEESSINKMKEICQKKGIAIDYYTNTKLPVDFPKSLKPDFMVNIIDQYVIFDSKLSKSSSVDTYIKDQIKKSASKYKPHGAIFFPFVFFVIPSIDIHKIKEIYIYHENFHFYVISVEAFEPIIRTLKKLEDYSFTEDIDPENREKIVHSIARMSRHIKQQNATNLLGTTYGIKTLNELQELPNDIVHEVENKENNISIETFNLKNMQEIRASKDKQIDLLLDFLKPKEPMVNMEDINKADEDIKNFPL